jgi:hypothetical protein
VHASWCSSSRRRVCSTPFQRFAVGTVSSCVNGLRPLPHCCHPSRILAEQVVPYLKRDRNSLPKCILVLSFFGCRQMTALGSHRVPSLHQVGKGGVQLSHRARPGNQLGKMGPGLPSCIRMDYKCLFLESEHVTPSPRSPYIKSAFSHLPGQLPLRHTCTFSTALTALRICPTCQPLLRYTPPQIHPNARLLRRLLR